MHFERAGQGNPPVVFVHGYACSSGDWRSQMERFRATHTVVACDLRGHGSTPGLPADCSIETYGADVAALLAELKLPPTVLVGHSMGCRVVLQVYLAAPETIAGLVLIDGSRQGFGDRDTVERVMHEQLRATGYGSFARRLFEEMFVASSDPKLKAEIVERALQLPSGIGTALMPRMRGWDARYMEQTLAAVRAPMLVIQSTTINAERVRVPLAAGQTSAWLDLVRQRAPAARIEIVPGVGHFPQLEAPEQVNALIAGFISALR